MNRIAVIGSAGTGKSTLSRALGELLGLEVIHLDQLYWKPGWIPVPAEEFIQKHSEAISRASWIMDGFSDWTTLISCVEAADTIIFTDPPLWRCCWWAIKRQLKYAFRSRPDSPPDCPMLQKTWEVIRSIRYGYVIRPKIIELLEDMKGRKQIVHLRSLAELHTFWAGLKASK